MDTGRIGVRKLPVGVTVSALVHVALVGLVAVQEPAERPEPELPPVEVEIVPIEVAPPAVALAAPPEPEPEPEPRQVPPPPPPPPEPQLRQTPEPPSPPPPEPAASRQPAISTGSPATVEVAPPAGAVDPGATPPARSRWFDLRRGRAAVDLRLPAGTHDDLDHVPRGTGPAPVAPATGQLQDAGGGNRRSDQGPFVATVAPDGSVTLKDRRNFQMGIALPTASSIGTGIQRWYYSDKGPDGKRGERALEKEVGGSIDQGDGELDKGDRSKTVIIPVVRGGFDLTDAFMRGKGNDPYASKKLAFLDSTRDERVQIGAAHRAEQLRRTTQIVQRNLDRLWQQVPEPRARRAAVVVRWAEVGEAGDGSVGEAGRAARRLVVGFIRARLPAGGPDAYTADELAALNRRRQSKTPFAPYDQP